MSRPVELQVSLGSKTIFHDSYDTISEANRDSDEVLRALEPRYKPGKVVAVITMNGKEFSRYEK